jgi:hypothetical protein
MIFRSLLLSQFIKHNKIIHNCGFESKTKTFDIKDFSEEARDLSNNLSHFIL